MVDELIEHNANYNEKTNDTKYYSWLHCNRWMKEAKAAEWKRGGGGNL